MLNHRCLRSKRYRALLAMLVLGIPREVADHFMKDGTLYCSYYNCFENSVSVSSEIDQKILDVVRCFEKRTGCLVFHIMQPYTNYKTNWRFLYVSKRPRRRDCDLSLQHGVVNCYHYVSDFLELAYESLICVRSFSGGLIQIS